MSEITAHGARMMDGVTAEVHAAGLGGRLSPGVIAIFFLSVAIGALAVWYVRTQDAHILIEPAPVAIADPPPASPPPVVVVAPPPDPKTVNPEPPKPAPPTPESAKAKTKTTKTKSVKVKRPRPKRPKRPKRPPREPEQPAVATGKLRMRSEPPGLRVTLRGKKIGKTPFTTELPAGEQKLEFSSRSLGVKRAITVQIAEGTFHKKKLVIRKGTLKVVSRPFGKLSINGVDKGETPFNGEVYEGTHTVKVVTDDGASQTQTVTVGAGKTKLVKIRF